MKASDLEGPLMESLPSERRPKEMDIDEQSGAEQDPAKLENNIQEQDSPSHASQKSPPKNGIPPRRLSSMTKRAVPSTPTPTSRSNPVTSSRTAPGTSLNKPPTRPLASSSSRRLTTKSAASTPASSAPKKRPSANQSDKKGKDDISASDENTKPVGNKLETRRFGHSKGDSKTASDNNNQNKAKLQHISETGQPSASAPNKPSLRSTTNSSRPSAVQSTPRHNHPATSSTRRIQGAAGPEANRKRLSTIPASPAPARDDSTPSASAPLTPSSSRATRPMMLTRKSTMSVTIEQRLREMELVHQMIHIAMAEDGDESDEAKEEYGRKVDESLASLRIRLEEARRNEGLVDTEAVQSQLNGFPEEEKSGGAMALSTANIDELQKSLPESLNKELLSNTEVSGLIEELGHDQVTEKDARDVDKERDVLIANLEKKISSFQEDADRLRIEHSSKIEELMTNHKNEIAASHASIQEAEAMHEKQLAQSIQDLEDAKRIAVSQCSEEAASKLASHIDTHKVKLEALEQQLSDERKQRLNTAARVQRLQSEISDLQALLAEERQKSTDVSQGYQDNHNKALEERDHDLAKLQKAIEDLQTVHRNELKEKESIQVERDSINSERDTLRHELHELETTHRSTVASHEKEIVSKQRQMDGLSRVIKEFQDKIQKIHELKEQTVHETKLDLAHEHEKVLSDLRREHQEEIAGVALEHNQKSQSLQEEHQNLMHSAQINHENEVERIQELLKESERSLEEAKLASDKAESAGNAFNLKIHNLELERDEAENARLSMEKALNDASTVIVSLKKSFELLSAESLNKDAQQKAAIQSLRDELLNKSKLHADSMDSVEEKGQRSLEDLQKQYDALLEKWSSTEKEHPAVLDTLKREHAEAAQKQAEALKDLSNTHVKEIEATVAEAEEKHQQSLKDLQQKYDERYDLLRQDLQDTESAKNQVLQKEYNITVSDLRSQLQKHTELLANAEDQLQVFRSTQNTDTNPDENDDLREQLEELRTQLANSQAQVAQTNEEIANLAGSLEDARKALEDTSELNSLRFEMTELAKKHAAEVAKYQDKISLENEKREKERNQGAEVRDRLASEAEKTTNELLAARAEVDEHQKALHLSSNKLKEASKKHATVHQSAERHKNEYEKVVEKLRVAQAEIEKYKAAELGSESEEVRPNAQELEALQLAADAERTQNAELKRQLQEAKALAEQRVIKIREVESALKVTTAELVEAQTARPNGGEFSASPAPRSGLRSSRWGTTAKTDDECDSMEQEGEELGSSIEGNMAGIQEQIRQLEDINQDLLEDEHRIMRFLSKISDTSSAPALEEESDEDEVQ